MAKREIWIALVSTLLCLPSFAQQLNPHTEFRVKLTGPLSTVGNRTGDKLAAQVISPKAFAGATLEGGITECSSKSLLHRKAVLRFTFKTLQTKKGAIPIATDVKVFSSSKGGENTDEAGSEVEHSSESADAGGSSFDKKVDQVFKKTVKPAEATASAIVVQMSSKEKDITFAPGSVFVLDVSRIEDAAQAAKDKK